MPRAWPRRWRSLSSETRRRCPASSETRRRCPASRETRRRCPASRRTRQVRSNPAATPVTDAFVTGSARLGRHASTMAAGTAVSRVLGVVRTWMLIAAVGINVGAANAFDVANRAPNFLFAIIAGGVLNAVLVPQIVKAQRSANGQEYVDRLLTLAGVLILGMTLVLTLGATVVVGLYIDNWTPKLTALAVR